jgi:uncharacterized Zn finger protein
MTEITLVCPDCGATFDWVLPKVGLYGAVKLNDNLPARCSECRKVHMYQVQLPSDD